MPANSSVLMPACVAMMSSAMPFSPEATSDFRSPANTAENGACDFHSGFCGARAFTRSRANASWVYMGCSIQSVPSLSNTAIRSASGTKLGPPSRVVAATKSRIARLDPPSIHDGSGAGWALARSGARRTDARRILTAERIERIAISPSSEAARLYHARAGGRTKRWSGRSVQMASRRWSTKGDAEHAQLRYSTAPSSPRDLTIQEPERTP
jgi:hypothetical protein